MQFTFGDDITTEQAIEFSSNAKTSVQRVQHILETNCPWRVLNSDQTPITWQPEMTLHKLLWLLYDRQQIAAVANEDNPFVVGDKVRCLPNGTECRVDSIEPNGFVKVSSYFTTEIHFSRLNSTDPDFAAMCAAKAKTKTNKNVTPIV